MDVRREPGNRRRISDFQVAMKNLLMDYPTGIGPHDKVDLRMIFLKMAKRERRMRNASP